MPVWEPDERPWRRWPDWSFWWTAPHRAGPARGRTVAVAVNAAAALALVPRVSTVAAGNGPVLAVLLAGAVVGYGVAVPLVVGLGPSRTPAGRTALVALLFGLAVLPAVALRAPAYLTDCTFAVAAGLMLLPLRYSLSLGFGTAAAQVAWMILMDGAVDGVAVATLVGVTAVLGMIFALLFTIGHLRAARDRIRQLAVAGERERVARDLHDVLGHSLSTMTVKTGLARRILESSGDVEQASAELREVEGLSRQALSDVRATVSGYRTVDLAAEITGAGVALRAAGVRADLPEDADVVATGLREVFGHVVREAVTNVIRHAGATTCRVRLGPDWVTVTDDGTAGVVRGPGNGLTGLAERLATVSATLEHGRDDGGGFRVVARGPAPDPAQARAGVTGGRSRT